MCSKELSASLDQSGMNTFFVPPPKKKRGEVWCHLTPKFGGIQFSRRRCASELDLQNLRNPKTKSLRTVLGLQKFHLSFAILCQLSPQKKNKTKGQSFMKQTDNLNQKNRRPYPQNMHISRKKLGTLSPKIVIFSSLFGQDLAAKRPPR